MKNPYISKRYWQDKSTAMGKSGEMAKAFDDVINLSLGDPDLITDERIIDAAFADAKRGHTKYTDFRGDPELRAEIVKFYKEDYNMDVSDEEVFVCTSGCEGMFLALQAILDDGDEVIIQAPYFTPYKQQIELARGVAIELTTLEEEDFQISIERLESLITEKTKAIIINSPSNPTGNCLTVETMEKIGQVAKKHDLLVIADDIYTAFSYQNPFVPFASLPGMKKRTITLNSFSKNFTMTGWRIGNIIAPAEIIRVIQQINENVVFTAPSISQRAALFALRHRKEIQPAMVEEYRKRMFYAAERINEIPKLSVANPPKGSFYLFVNIKETGLTSEEAAELFLREAHVLVLPGNAFGTCGEGYLRIACTVGVDTLKEAFDRIGRIQLLKEE
ncbi:MAG: pyridoxal phosphate-dependent aminotransferase [Firmicutes bacterium]|nr:pyridoxal phosphate-dependent aminotransferase [Bacillota bacterium]